MSVIERVDPIAPIGPSVTVANGGSSAPYDVADYSSISVQYAGAIGAAGGREVLLVEWLAGGIVVDSDVISYHYSASYPNVISDYWHLPVRGTQVQFTYYGNPGGWGGNVYKTTRPTQGGRLGRSFANGAGAALTVVPFGAIPGAGSIGPFYVPPVTRAVSMRTVLAAGASITFTLSGVYATAGAPTTLPLFQEVRTVTGTFNEILVPGIGLEMTLLNNNAGATSAGAIIWDVS